MRIINELSDGRRVEVEERWSLSRYERGNSVWRLSREVWLVEGSGRNLLWKEDVNADGCAGIEEESDVVEETVRMRNFPKEFREKLFGKK